MPIRRRFLTRRGALTNSERMDLQSGHRGAFASDTDRRAAWCAHRDDLLARVRAGYGSGPQAFWDYEGPAELRAARDWRCVTPEPTIVESYGWQRAAEIRAYADLCERRREWFGVHRGTSAGMTGGS